MKKVFLSAVMALSFIGLPSCSDDKNDGPDKDENVEAADINYTKANASSWGNYMVQVAYLLRSDAQNLYNSWTQSYEGGKPFAEIFKQHNGGDYSSALSCVDQMIEGCAEIANEVGTAKIGDPFNLWVSGEKTRAVYAVESWYSWHSRDDYSNNIMSIRNTYYGSLDGTVNSASLSALMASVNPTLDTQMKEAIADASAAILGIPQPFRNNINSSETRTAMTACADLEDLLSKQLKTAVANLGNDSRLQAIVDRFVDGVALPAYSDLAAKNSALYDKVVAFKNNPSNSTFAAACEAWLTAREPWEKSEAFLFGPVDALGLDPNMDSWPLDQDAIVQILNSGNYDNLDWTNGDDDDKIEAVQSVRGFHTLEFLLFKDGNPRKVD